MLCTVLFQQIININVQKIKIYKEVLSTRPLHGSLQFQKFSNYFTSDVFKIYTLKSRLVIVSLNQILGWKYITIVHRKNARKFDN